MRGQQHNDDSGADSGQMTVTTSADEQCPPAARPCPSDGSTRCLPACLPPVGSEDGDGQADNLCPHRSVCVCVCVPASYSISHSFYSPCAQTGTYTHIAITPALHITPTLARFAHVIFISLQPLINKTANSQRLQAV